MAGLAFTVQSASVCHPDAAVFENLHRLAVRAWCAQPLEYLEAAFPAPLAKTLLQLPVGAEDAIVPIQQNKVEGNLLDQVGHRLAEREERHLSNKS